MVVRFKIFQAMMFRRAGEFDPSSRGVYSRASSFIVPTPSTLAGALASLYAFSYSKAEGWVEEYKMALDNPMFKGPFLKVNNLWYFDCSLEQLLISQHNLYEYIQNISEIMKARNSREIRKLNERKEELVKKIRSKNIFKMQERIGIGLKVRENDSKTVDEEKGKIYNAEYIEYGDFKNKNNVVEIYLDVINPGNLRVGRYYIRLGGEGRVVELTVDESKMSMIEELKISDYANTLYVASHLLYETGKSIKDAIEIEIGQNVEIYGNVDIVGVGYSLARERRKPIYQALVPGSVIFINEGKVNSREIYEKGLGIGKEIGYGTIIPVELKGNIMT